MKNKKRTIQVTEMDLKERIGKIFILGIIGGVILTISTFAIWLPMLIWQLVEYSNFNKTGKLRDHSKYSIMFNSGLIPYFLMYKRDFEAYGSTTITQKVVKNGQ